MMRGHSGSVDAGEGNHVSGAMRREAVEAAVPGGLSRRGAKSGKDINSRGGAEGFRGGLSTEADPESAPGVYSEATFVIRGFPVGSYLDFRTLAFVVTFASVSNQFVRVW